MIEPSCKKNSHMYLDLMIMKYLSLKLFYAKKVLFDFVILIPQAKVDGNALSARHHWTPRQIG